MRAIISSIFSLFIAMGSFAQISGKITDNNNTPLVGVNIIIKGTQKGSETDFDGNFEIKNITGEQTLIISSIGYKTKEVKVIAPNNNVSINLYEGNELLQEIEVTSRNNTFSRKKTAYVAKLPLKDMENATVYSTVTNELLKSQIVTDLDQAMTNATGVYKLWEGTGRQPGNGTSFYSMRGFSVQPQLVDGIAGITFSAVEPSYIERIEVIKGPTATLYGSTETSLGGLINVVTKKPFKGEGGSISYTLGSFGLHRGSLDYNTPLGNGDDIFLRVNASYLSQDSFQDAGFKKTFFIAPSLTFKVNERFNISTAFEFSKTKQTNPSMLFLRSGTKLLNSNVKEMGVDPKKSFTSNDIYLTNPVYNARVIGDYKISDSWTSKTIFSGIYGETEGDYQYQFDGGIGGILSLSALSKPLKNGISKTQAGLNQLIAIGANNPASAFYKKYLQAQGALGVLNKTNNSLNFMLADAGNLFNQNAFTRVYDRRDMNATRFNLQQNFIGDFKIGDVRNRMVVGLDYLNKNQVNRNKFMHSNILNLSKIPELLGGLNALGLNKQANIIAGTFGQFPYFDAFLSPKGKILPSSFTPNAKYSVTKESLDKVFDGQTVAPIKTKSQVLSAYVSDVIDLTSNLTLSLGLRLDHFKQDGDTRFTSDDYTKTTISPSVGVLFQPIKDKVSVFANYQTGYKDNDPEINRAQNIVTSVFKPTKANQFEGGVKTNLLNGKLNIGASYYHITVENFTTGDPYAQIFPIKIDIAEAVSKGFELEANANPIAGLNLRASFSKNDMKYTDVSSEKAIVPGQLDANGKAIYGRKVVELLGRRPLNSGPETVYNFWADYQFQEGSFAEKFGIGIGFNGASEHLTINDGVSGTFTLPSYTIYNASLYYNADKFRVGIKANNFTDTIYYTGWSTINAQAPRSFLGTISYKF